MAVAGNGEVVGSVSGGCVEGAVYELAGEVPRTGQPVTVTYGVREDDVFEVGLTCGGVVEILVQPDYPELSDVLSAITDGLDKSAGPGRRRRVHGDLRADPRPKFDVPVLERPRAAGVTGSAIARLSSPIGLDPGADPGGDRGGHRGRGHPADLGWHRAPSDRRRTGDSPVT